VILSSTSSETPKPTDHLFERKAQVLELFLMFLQPLTKETFLLDFRLPGSVG
jgi:hypothetical protein